ncbi:3-hydroxyacyl-CoA dehydrogenase NAD-binding domain-containing protein [Exiguobacterium antarcticum]|uniref:3-hydroxyacyl-CoA dehydrogenase NAD-binding domain-containing protein n=1 Tax=Exiguobacterium antarcticum TaxID=132920 RepID=A0ABT6QXU4_9BACL|nr:3-hydroxyacyl-CoA dehydrogenase/enoyl-CoA hydratase family protein [Exiguobacterium antarcticum]MDI3233510.1 3-hydroxyacyl-CoA dehydrogenase NAD-binding domain-containing protein [Exiguobacterium antarcticum]
MASQIGQPTTVHTTKHIQFAVIIGSGVMGAGIAAHLANAGIRTLMLDIVPKELTAQETKQGLTLEDAAVRSRIARDNRQKLLKQNPAPLASKQLLDLIEVGNLEDDLERLKEADWVIEVIVERLDVKQQLFATIEPFLREDAIVSSNTSGISIEAMRQGRSDSFNARFLGTHFFNPPRYLKLLELIPTTDTAPEVVQFMKQFAEERLGKGVVIAKDTPNFIGNRIGTYGLLVTLDEMKKGGYSIGEVDSVTGPLLGRPSSATFRTLDVVGIDTFVHVANNVYDLLPDGAEKDTFAVPAEMKRLVDEGALGAKSGQGFYKKVGKQILELDLATFEYVEKKALTEPSIGQAKALPGAKNKLKAVVFAKDRVGALLWPIHAKTLLYSAQLTHEIADDIKAIDEAMKWGFGWKMGPFETWDALGVEKTVAKMKQDGYDVPAWVDEMLASGTTSFYNEDGRFYDAKTQTYVGSAVNPKEIRLRDVRKSNGVLLENNGARLMDLGDDVAVLEFTSKSNAIGVDIMQMIEQSIDLVEKNHRGLVIANDGKNFCVGANLAMMLMEAEDENWFELDWIINKFQQSIQKIRYASRPIVVAPQGMTLGGGTEISLPAARIQAGLETYMGLVEVGVGLIPGGGGNVNTYRRLLENTPDGLVNIEKAAQKTFENVAMAKVSKSAFEARELGYVRTVDQISMNRDHLTFDAKQLVLELDRTGYTAPAHTKIPVVGRAGKATLELATREMFYGGYISEHDLKIASKLAHVIAGGNVSFGTAVDEQYMLDIEREAFLSLIGELKTQQRMQHMLVKGKPLRN